MENENHSLNHFAMMHGLYLGFGLVLNQLVFYLIGIPFSQVSGLLTYAIIIAGGGFAMWSFGKLNTEEGLPYSRALGLGTLVSLFGSLIAGLFTFILYKFIDAGMVDKMLANLEQILLSQGQGDDVVEAAVSFYRKFMSPAVVAIAQVISVIFWGFLFSLILAIFLKKEPSNPFHEVREEEEEEY
jgi:hypothetical protein